MPPRPGGPGLWLTLFNRTYMCSILAGWDKRDSTRCGCSHDLIRDVKLQGVYRGEDRLISPCHGLVPRTGTWTCTKGEGDECQVKHLLWVWCLEQVELSMSMGWLTDWLWLVDCRTWTDPRDMVSGHYPQDGRNVPKVNKSKRVATGKETRRKITKRGNKRSQLTDKISKQGEKYNKINPTAKTK